MFRAEWVDNDWKNITELPFCSDTFSTQHPYLSPDGTFGEPQNLGDVIKTEHLEQFPFITADGTLYFASNGHEGMGGLDLFMTKKYQDNYAKPLNLGQTINSGLDDFGFVLNEKTQEGFFSSNRKGYDNLYSFKRKDNERRYLVEGDVRDKVTKQLLPGTQVSLYDENDVLVGQMIVSSNADYFFNTKPNKTYRLEAIRDLYIPHSEQFSTNDEGKARYSIEL